MSTYPKVLFIDDNPRYANPLIDIAFNHHHIELIYYEDWEQGKSALISQPDNFQAIILDGRGKVNQDDKGDNPKHLSIAIQDIKDLQQKGIHINYVVNTAYLEELSSYFQVEYMVDKMDTERLFAILKQLIYTSDIHRIKSLHATVFATIGNGYLPKICEELLINALLPIENNQLTLNTLNLGRQLIEHVYMRLHEYDDNLIPYEFFRYEKGHINLKFCELRLTGKEIRNKGDVLYPAIQTVLPEHLCIILGPITAICHSGSHPSNEKVLTKYSLSIVMNGIMDLLIWFKQFVDKYYLSKPE